MFGRGNIYDSCFLALKQKAKLPILKTRIGRRNAFPESQLYGCVAKSFGDNAASREVDAAASEVAHLLGIRLQKA